VRRAFTLIELLVVIALIALLVGVLLPALGASRRTGRTVVCAATQRSIAQAFVLYSNDHKELVVPSYNMSGVDTFEPLDGWAPILDRDQYMQGARETRRGPFVCPDTVDVDALELGQTGTDPLRPKGWMEWPFFRSGSGSGPVLIEARGFNRILRVSYWINALNPIGGSTYVEQNVYFTASAGYGPSSNGLYLEQHKLSGFSRPSALIATADGVYAGRHRDNRLGTPNSRIGYRHPAKGGGAVNAAFADGSARLVGADQFPRGTGAGNDYEEVLAENSGEITLFANPEKFFSVP
jgi:prepilin-type N-terminal cleavage/methylation domain-containing protein/prepilin-type processing-associated H-X9-DG protein